MPASRRVDQRAGIRTDAARDGRQRPAVRGAQPQPLRPQTVGRNPFRRERTDCCRRSFSWAAHVPPRVDRRWPRTVSNRASTRSAIRAESEGE